MLFTGLGVKSTTPVSSGRAKLNMFEMGKDLVTKFQSESSGFWKDWLGRTMELTRIIFGGHTQSVGKKRAEVSEEGLG